MRLKHRVYLLSFCVLLLFLTGCTHVAVRPRVSLDSGWLWSATKDDSTSWLQLEKNHMSSLEDLLPGGMGVIWLKNDFSIPPELEGQNLSVYLGRITMADRTRVNDVFIGGEGSFEPDGFSEWNKARLYPLLSPVIKSGVNTLLVEIRVDHEAAIVSNPFIGTRDDTHFAALMETFWNSTVNLISAAIMIIIACYHLMLFLKRRVDRENLLFALVNFMTAIYFSNFFITELPWIPFGGMSFLLFQKIVANALTFIIVYLVSSFICVFLGRTESRMVFFLRILCLVIPLAAVFLASDYGSLRALRLWTQLFILPPLLYIMFMAISSLIQKNKEAQALLWGLSPLAVSVILDIGLHQGLKLYSLPYITSLGWQMVVFSLLFVLANRFAGARTGIEELNRHLEKKVDERTSELSEANLRLKSTNDELEDARIRAERDMRMAAFVQQSFFARRAPTVNGWDISFVFKPMSGVSGDLYDFYTDENELRGVGLFDVSGHGIAAGLVTMLAKTIIWQQFQEGKNTILSNVLSRIDRKIIQEKGNIENYLTGLLLRITDNKVEYVSAGHPELLFRSGKNGMVRPVALEGKSLNGRMLGIDGLSEGYTTIGFTLAEGDSLLLFTDCLPETRNTGGDEFGMDRIREAFARAGTGSAEERLECVMEAFGCFIAGIPLNDDLTVILLHRRQP